MGRIGRAFGLLKTSWRFLRQDRELLWLPVMAFAVSVGSLAVLGAVAWAARAFEETAPKGLQYAFYAAGYFVTYGVAIFFNAALVGAAAIRMDGGDPTVADGLRVARGKLGKILMWAALAASVGMVLRVLEDKAKGLGRFVVGLVGAAWGAVTYFVVPVLLFEPHGVGESVKRSGSLFKSRWGEMFVGTGSIGLAMFLISIPVFLLCALLFAANQWLGLAMGLLSLGALSAVGSALSAIFCTALYRFASNGVAAGGFAEDQLQGAYQLKR